MSPFTGHDTDRTSSPHRVQRPSSRSGAGSAPGSGERADAARNRQAILEAADRLYAEAASGTITMDAVARAAGVGKGTIFRRFGDSTGLLRALYASKLSPLREQIESGPPPLGPGEPPAQRVVAVVDAVTEVKLASSHLMLALEAVGGESESLFGSTLYQEVHRLLTALIEAGGAEPSRSDASWTAHVLLSAVRADLLRHLVDVEGLSHEAVRAQVGRFVLHTLAAAN